VTARLTRSETGVGQDLQDLCRSVEVHEVELEVLPRRNVAAAVARVILGNDRHGLHLLGVYAAVWQLHADHLVVHLALSVDAHAQAEGCELALEALFVLAEQARFGLEVLDLFVECDEDVAGFKFVGDLGMGADRCFFDYHEIASIPSGRQNSRLCLSGKSEL